MAKKELVSALVRVEIFWDDLSEQGQQKLHEATSCDMGGENWDTIPLFILEFEPGAIN